jgi:hypothetical protein
MITTNSIIIVTNVNVFSLSLLASLLARTGFLIGIPGHFDRWKTNLTSSLVDKFCLSNGNPS